MRPTMILPPFALLLCGVAFTLLPSQPAPSALAAGERKRPDAVAQERAAPGRAMRRTAVAARALRPATLRYAVLGELRATPRGGKPVQVGVTGVVALGIVAEGAASYTVAADLSGLQVVAMRVNDVPVPIDNEFLHAVRAPVRLRWTADLGEQLVVGARDDSVASVQRAVLDALAGGFGRGARLKGEDAFGAYTADLVGSGERAERRKVAYRAAEGLGERTAGGLAHYLFDPSEGWPRSAAVDETCAIEGSSAGGTYAVVLTATLQSVGAPPPAAASAAGPNVHALIEDLAAMLAARGLGGDATRQVWEQLIAALARDPSLTDVVLARVPLCADPTLANLLLSALGAAGHEQAQMGLVTALGDLRLSPQVREGAAVAMVQIQRPSDATLAALRADAEREVGDFNGPGGARLLAWGTLAARATDAEARVGELLALGERARGLGAWPFWVEALGNTGHPSARAAIHAELDAADPLVRFSAASAARGQLDAGTTSRLVQRLAVEPEAEIRRQLTASLAGREPAETAPALELAIRDAAESVRRQAILVAGRLSPERALALLERAAQADASADLRELATKLRAGLAARG